MTSSLDLKKIIEGKEIKYEQITKETCSERAMRHLINWIKKNRKTKNIIGFVPFSGHTYKIYAIYQDK